jgi:hypothetical protein
LNIRNATEKLANDFIKTSFDLLDRINVDRERKKELGSVVSSLIGRDK